MNESSLQLSYEANKSENQNNCTMHAVQLLRVFMNRSLFILSRWCLNEGFTSLWSWEKRFSFLEEEGGRIAAPFWVHLGRCTHVSNWNNFLILTYLSSIIFITPIFAAQWSLCCLLCEKLCVWIPPNYLSLHVTVHCSKESVKSKILLIINYSSKGTWGGQCPRLLLGRTA